MPYGEAYRLTTVLASDPGSEVHAALSGWPHPVSREWILGADQYDAFARAWFGRKANPMPRPWDKNRTTKKFGGTHLPQDVVRRVLDGKWFTT